MPVPISSIHNEPKTIFEKFFREYPSISYKRGEKIFRPAELEKNIFYVKSGFLKIYHVSKNGKEVIINVINAAHYNYLVFGLANYIKDYYIEALNDVEVTRVPKEALLLYLDRHPQAYMELAEPLSRCLRSTYAQLRWLKNGNSTFKIASIIYYLGKETGHTKNDVTTIGFRVTHQLIANFIGLTRETVTVQINNMRKQGVIQYENNILQIKNMSSLIRLTELE